MELRHIKELMNGMIKTGIVELSIESESKEQDKFKLSLKREGSVVHKQVEADSFGNASSEIRVGKGKLEQEVFLSHQRQPSVNLQENLVEEKNKTEKLEDKVYITSPMVGTFYTTPAPDQPVFVKKGDTVEKGTVVCIIEAMKVMNEVKAGISGTIEEILIENGHPVEFGSNLFTIIPN